MELSGSVQARDGIALPSTFTFTYLHTYLVTNSLQEAESFLRS